jgi:uncharacterized protein with GYD domain
MPTYISLLKWTDRGLRDVRESPQRVDAAKRAFSATGGSMTGFYLVLGEYDLVNIGEFPNDEAYTAAILQVASRGNVRPTSLKVFTEEEYLRIIASMAP